MSVLLSGWNNSGPTGRIFMEFFVEVFFEKSVEKIQVQLKSDKHSGTSPEDPCTFLIISPSVLPRMRNV